MRKWLGEVAVESGVYGGVRGRALEEDKEEEVREREREKLGDGWNAGEKLALLRGEEEGRRRASDWVDAREEVCVWVMIRRGMRKARWTQRNKT